MSEYRYELERTSKKHICPSCKKKRFVRYIDQEKREYLPTEYGRCDRETSCAYHLSPYSKKIFIELKKNDTHKYPNKKSKPEPISTVPVDIFKSSLNAYKDNHFVSYLIDHFGIKKTNNAISNYFIGTSSHWPGASIFWQIDTNGKIRSGKIMLYNPKTGKRVKYPQNHIFWVHKSINQPNFKLQQCLFGEHLLTKNNCPVGIVESEKTAVIASLYLPQFIWLATGGLSFLNEEKLKILKGRNVIFFPDVKGYSKWSKKIKQVSHLGNFKISKLLESKANEHDREQGSDIADYLINFEIDNFLDEEKREDKTLFYPEYDDVIEAPKWYSAEEIVPKQKPEVNIERWDNKIQELSHFLSKEPLSTKPIHLNDFTTIIDIDKFLESHFATLKAYNGNPYFKPTLNRLTKLKEIMIVGKQSLKFN